MPPKKASTPGPTAAQPGKSFRQRTITALANKKRITSESTEIQEPKDQGVKRKELLPVSVIGRKAGPKGKKTLKSTEVKINLIKSLKKEKTKLVMSVIGGGADFLSHTRLKTFKRHLMIAALNTDALIFTEGHHRTNMALCVKDALREFGLLDSKHVMALTMGNNMPNSSAAESLAHGQKQSTEEGRDGCCTTFCCRSSKGRVKPEKPAGDRTIYLSVDCTSDAMQRVSFRLEEQQKIASDLGAKLVLLLVNEDPDMVEAIEKAVSLDIAVIFIQGLGGLVDCLANMMPKPNGGKQVSKPHPDSENKGSSRDHTMESDCKDILNLFKTKSSPLNVFDLATDATNHDGLFQILRDAIHAKTEKQKMDLAVSWPDYRLARQLISDGSFEKDSKKQDKLHSLMLSALMMENTDFVDFLLNNGVSIKSFLTQGNLRKLYKNSVFSGKLQSSSTNPVDQKTLKQRTTDGERQPWSRRPKDDKNIKEDLYMQDIIDMFDVLLGDVYNFKEKSVSVHVQGLQRSQWSDQERQELFYLRVLFGEKIFGPSAKEEKDENKFIEVLFKDTRQRNLSKFRKKIERLGGTVSFSKLVREVMKLKNGRVTKNVVTKQEEDQLRQKNIEFQRKLDFYQKEGTGIPQEDGIENQAKDPQVKRQNVTTQEDFFGNQTIDWEKFFIDWYIEANRTRNQRRGSVDQQAENTVDFFEYDRTPDLQDSALPDAFQEDSYTFKHPELLLFLWAIVSSKFEMAQFLWRDVKDRLTAALIACVTLKAMKKRIINNPTFMDEREEYAEKIRVFEGLAIACLNKCNNENAEKTNELLTRTQAFWEGLTCLEIADQAKCTNFIAQESCQALAERIWKGKDGKSNIKDEDWASVIIKVFYTIFAFFVVIPTFLLECSRNKRSGAYLWKSFKRIVENFPLTVTSPAFKFYINWFLFLGFLILYMYVLLVRIPVDTLQVPELILFCWFCTLFIEEVRLSIVMIPQGTKGKVSYFILNQTGFLNVTNYYLGLLLIIGWVINNQSPYLHGALCVNFIGFVVRLFFFLSINSQLGPRIFMMRRMIRDIIIFSVILIIMCFTYGTVVYSLQNKGAVRELQLSGLLDLPVNGFWLLLGNQPQDDANEDSTDLRIVIRGLLRVVYMMIACILMINLLIAAFSHTFNMVQEKKEEVRKYQRFQMIYKFYYKCPVPPPFNIFFYPLWFAYWCAQSCREGPKGDSFRKHLESDKEEDLLSWANYVVDTYVTGSAEEKDPVNTQVNDVLRKVQRIEKTDEGLYYFRENDACVSLRDIGKMLTNLQESVQSLADTFQALQDQRPK